MNDALAHAEQQLLAPGGLSQDDLHKILSRLMGPAVDAGDLYFQSLRHESWMLEDGIVKNGNHAVEQGAGIRAISGEKTGFAYADEIIMPALMQASSAARAIAGGGREGRVQAWRKAQAAPLYEADDPIQGLQAADKVDLMRQVDTYTRSLHPAVKQVIVSLAASHETVLVVATDGTLAADIRPLVRLNVSVVAEKDGRREQGSGGGGGRFAYSTLVEGNAWQKFADEAVRQAVLNLDAVDAPAGVMPVVLGPGWPGVLLHEAVGHGLEGDFNRKGISAFSGRMGERVASPSVTVVDDGTLKNRRGSLTLDDEGVPAQQTVLIENGVLKAYMQDKLNAGLMGAESTGNGRRESFAHLPMPRMTNTFMLPGEASPEDIIASVDDGLYAVNFGGGQVDITSGKFVFSASEAYRIRNGKVAEPVKGATLIGSGPEVMTRISMVADDLELDSGVGVCGKEGQSVPVGVGQPTVKVDALTVGGTES